EPHGELTERMRFAVEVLLEPKVRDPWGAVVDISHPRLRYELEIERRRDARGIERLVVAHEAAQPILKKEDNWLPGGKPFSRDFRAAFLRYTRGLPRPFLTTEVEGSVREFYIHQDGRKGRRRPAEAAEATTLSSITSTDF